MAALAVAVAVALKVEIVTCRAEDQCNLLRKSLVEKLKCEANII